MVVALRTLVHRRLRRVLAVAAVLTLAAALVGAHSGLSEHHHGEHGTTGTAIVVVVCLAVAAPVVAFGFAVLRRRRYWPVRPPAVWLLALEPCARPESPPPRAGPALLQVFRH